MAYRVDLGLLQRSDGSRDFESVIALLQAMLHDAGFAFVNLVPGWEQRLSADSLTVGGARFLSDALFLRGLLAAEQHAWNEIAEGRQYTIRREDAPFQTLDPEAAMAYEIADDDDELMLTADERELLGTAVVTRLRLSRTRLREWSESEASHGGPGDAPMMTPDDDMSSAGGGSQGGPELGTGGAMTGVNVATAAPGDDTHMGDMHQGVYIPVAVYPPVPVPTPRPRTTAASPPPDLDDENESKFDLQTAEVAGTTNLPRAPRLPEVHQPVFPTESDLLRDQALRHSQQQIAELQAAMDSRNEQERARLQAFEEAMRSQAAEQEFNRAERKQRKATRVGEEIAESRRKEAADAEIANLKLRLYQIEQQQALDLEVTRQANEARIAKERAVSQREVEAISREAERLREEASAAIEAAATRAREVDEQAKRELRHQLHEARAREALQTERREAEEAELMSLREQVASAAARIQARDSSPTSSGRGRAGGAQPGRPRRNNVRNRSNPMGHGNTAVNGDIDVTPAGRTSVPAPVTRGVHTPAVSTSATSGSQVSSQQPTAPTIPEGPAWTATSLQFTATQPVAGRRPGAGDFGFQATSVGPSGVPGRTLPSSTTFHSGIPSSAAGLASRPAMSSQSAPPGTYPVPGSHVGWPASSQASGAYLTPGNPAGWSTMTQPLGSYPDPGSFSRPPMTAQSLEPGTHPGPGNLPRGSTPVQSSYPSWLPTEVSTWTSYFGDADANAGPYRDTLPWGQVAPEAQRFPGGFAGGGQFPPYGMSFRPFIAYDAVEPFDPTLPLEKRRLWWDKFQYTALMGGWREPERCTRLYSRLSHNEGTKAWIQQQSDAVRWSWQQLSDKFAKEFCRSPESPVERYLRLKQESRETPRTFLWRLNAAAVKANVDFRTPAGCRRHLNQYLKNLRDRELQLSLQGRLYLSVDELEETLRQVEEMERGMRRKPAHDVQFGRYKPPGAASGAQPRGVQAPRGQAVYAAMGPRDSLGPREPVSEELQWDDNNEDSGYGYEYSDEEEEDDSYAARTPAQEDMFREETSRPSGPREDQARRPPRRDNGPRRPPDPPPSPPLCGECGRPGHAVADCWQLMKCDRCGGKHPTQMCRRRECDVCGKLHPPKECPVLKVLKAAAQGGQLQGVPDEVLQHLRKGGAPPLNN